MQFFSNVTESELLEEDRTLLNCHIQSHGNVKPNVTVELTDAYSRRLAFEEHSPLNYSTVVQYSVSVTSSMSGSFYCNVTAAVITMETVSKTLDVTLSRSLTGELFEV